jgi:hypothetical protein
MVKRNFILFFTNLFVLAAYMSVISCILPVYVPPYHGTGLDISNIKAGITTKEDVFLKFGYVFNISEDEKLFTADYNLDNGFFVWLWFVGAGYSGSGGMYGYRDIRNNYEVEIEFDNNDIVKRCETFKLPRDQSQEKKPSEKL